MFIYIASSPVFRADSIGKIGCTQYPLERLSTYLTGCPPSLSPSHDIVFEGIWLTNAKSHDELYDYEDEVHNEFLQFRMVRNKPGDSEWFNFHGSNPYTEVKKFMDSRKWVIREVPISEVIPSTSTSRFLQKPYPKNLNFIKTLNERIAKLQVLQQPVIDSIQTFLGDAANKSGYVIAPCGSGKTMMTTKAIQKVKRCIICCPSRQIQNQWKKTLLEQYTFQPSQIFMVGGAGTTNPYDIQRILVEDNTYCLISTYMSSHLLVDILTNDVELLILDEAHHMAGIVSKDEKGEGRTRRLILKATEIGIKRLSLTYTPRFIIDNGSIDSEYISMDDDEIFGQKIYELKIRDLIREGVLPDYRLWILRDEARKGNGVIGKAECLLEAWDAREIVRGKEQYILHHLVVFAATTQEAKDLEAFFREKLTDTLVLRVEQGDSLEEPKRLFTEASRAILVNCFVLSEGVDIPAVNAVAIMYPKQSRGQITQMVLRGGRWYEGKSLFHVLIPTLGEEDLGGFEEVLCALASCDDQIRDEVMLHSSAINSVLSEVGKLTVEDVSAKPECIMIEEFEANLDELKKCFTNIRKNLFPSRESRRIQEFCIQKGIDTSVEYGILRESYPELAEDPRPKNMTWYNYLHPRHHERISAVDFVNTFLIPNNLHISYIFEKIQNIPKGYPTIQHVTDGFFGEENTNFTNLVNKYRINKRR